MSKNIRCKQAGRILGVTGQTVRRWTNEGKLPYRIAASGHRIFDEDEITKIAKAANGEIDKPKPLWFYARSSSGNDVTTATQLKKLEASYGSPDKTYQDAASGLNENRQKLNQMLRDLKQSGGARIAITNKDRLTRFGYRHLVELIEAYGGEVLLLDDDETKEPQEVLMQDFMSLLASFSGKFYRLRGWEQQRQLLAKAEGEINARA